MLLDHHCCPAHPLSISNETCRPGGVGMQEAPLVFLTS
jgi:hypothetical protein